MANVYVRSTDGNDADSGLTWALAKATLTGAVAAVVSNDTVYVSQSHAETSAAGTVSYAWPGNASTPTKIICANDGAEPPTSGATSGTVTTTGNSGITLITGTQYAQYEGLTFNCATGTGSNNITLCGLGYVVYKKCNFKLICTGTSSRIMMPSNVVARVLMEDCGFRFADASQLIVVTGRLTVRGGSILAGGTSPTTVFDCSAQLGILDVEGFDFSNCAAGVNLCATSQNAPSHLRFVDCKLPASWSGSFHINTITQGAVAEMINCAAGAQNYKYWRKQYGGEIRDETTIVRMGGATDQTTPIAYKMVASAQASYPVNVLESQPIQVWNATVGSPVTATIEVVTDNVTLKDDEAWIEVMYLSSSSAPLGTRITDAKANYPTAGANQTSSSVTWTTTGLTTPVKQKLSVTFTPQMAGYIVARVVLAKASTTMYIDPKITLS